VNRLTDIARDYVHTKQLRELIAWEVLQAIEAAKREALLEAANLLFESTEEPPINGNQLAQMRVSMIAEKLRYLAE
jgi:hypothetical protein